MTHREASNTVRKWAEDYNEQTDSPMTIETLKATNNIDTISAIEVNNGAWERGEEEELRFIVIWEQ